MTFNTGLSRDGPGLLVRDLMGEEPDADLKRLAALSPDIAVLQNVDYDHDHIVLGLIQARLAALGHEMPHAFTSRPNTGIDSGFDLDRNGKLGEPRDMLGYGRFAGQGGIVVLSRFEIVENDVYDLSGVQWRDEDAAALPAGNYFPDALLARMPLHSVAAWDVAIRTPKGLLRLLTADASPPAFDGPEDRNGLRNAAELRFWSRYINTHHLADQRFVLLGTLNNDPSGGDGHKRAINQLLGHTALQDPKPMSDGNSVTADWPDRNLALRVDYILPSHRLGVRAAGVERAPQAADGTRHYPVWVDIVWE